MSIKQDTNDIGKRVGTLQRGRSSSPHYIVC